MKLKEKLLLAFPEMLFDEKRTINESSLFRRISISDPEILDHSSNWSVFIEGLISNESRKDFFLILEHLNEYSESANKRSIQHDLGIFNEIGVQVLERFEIPTQDDYGDYVREFLVFDVLPHQIENVNSLIYHSLEIPVRKPLRSTPYYFTDNGVIILPYEQYGIDIIRSK